MSYPRLRVFHGPEAAASVAEFEEPAARRKVSVPLGEVLPVLVDAVRDRRMWVRDFADDEVTISSDLYEVLLAYQHLYRPSA